MTVPDYFRTAHEELVAGLAHRFEVDADYAMDLVINLPKRELPDRTDVLEAAAIAVVGCITASEIVADPAAQEAFRAWYASRIRKISRRARNIHWERVQELPGFTATVTASAPEPAAQAPAPAPAGSPNLAAPAPAGGVPLEPRAPAPAAMVRAFPPEPVGQAHPLLNKLQIEGTELPPGRPSRPPECGFALTVDAGLGMTMGKTAAQVGHASMLALARLAVDTAWKWAQAGFPLSVSESDSNRFAQLVELASQRSDAVIVRDGGFTEIAPGSLTVVALPSGL
ncbi:MAG: aminoacyl-tRNA hydrolase [Corynebacterium sp.]|nr:aminoacyl-tRNA hydrolase [Corynebacterium sp.]